MNDAQVLPVEIREHYRYLSDQAAWIHGRWNVLQQVFGDPNSVELANTAAPGFFFLAQQDIQNEIIMSICRMLDPAGHGGKENLSFDLVNRMVEKLRDDVLTSFCRSHGSSEDGNHEAHNHVPHDQQVDDLRGLHVLAQRLGTLTDSLKDEAKPLKKHRHKRLGHRDRKTALAGTPPPVTIASVLACMELITEYLNTLEEHYGIPPVGYQHMTIGGDGENLIHWLDYGQRYVDSLRGKGSNRGTGADLE